MVIQFAPALQIAGREQQHSIAVNHLSAAIGKERTVRVSIEGDAEIGTPLQCLRRDNLRMQSPAMSVNVAAVGCCVSDLNVRSETREEIGCDRRRRPVRAVQHQANTGKIERREELPEVVLIFGDKARLDCGSEKWDFDTNGALQLPKDLRFDAELHFVRQFVTVTGENLDAVVAPWIMGSRDDDTGGKSILVRKVRNSGSCNHASVRYGCAAILQSFGYHGRNPGTGLTCVRAKQYSQGFCPSAKRPRQRYAGRKNRFGV